MLRACRQLSCKSGTSRSHSAFDRAHLPSCTFSVVQVDLSKRPPPSRAHGDLPHHTQTATSSDTLTHPDVGKSPRLTAICQVSTAVSGTPGITRSLWPPALSLMPMYLLHSLLNIFPRYSLLLSIYSGYIAPKVVSFHIQHLFVWRETGKCMWTIGKGVN